MIFLRPGVLSFRDTSRTAHKRDLNVREALRDLHNRYRCYELVSLSDRLAAEADMRVAERRFTIHQLLGHTSESRWADAFHPNEHRMAWAMAWADVLDLASGEALQSHGLWSVGDIATASPSVLMYFGN